MNNTATETTKTGGGFRAVLCACTDTLLREIAEPRLYRNDVALTYALAMRSDEPTDWARVNKAILARWSMAGLIYIKERAHKHLARKVEASA